MRKCFNCGAPLPMNSIVCKECGYSPDLEFMRTCPNKRIAKCLVTGKMCDFMGTYQTCPVKNKIDAECDY